MDISNRLEFYDFINEMFKNEPTDEIKNKVLNKFDVVIQKDEEKAKDVSKTHIIDLLSDKLSEVLPFNIGETVYLVLEREDTHRHAYHYVGIFKDIVEKVVITIDSYGFTLSVKTEEFMGFHISLYDTCNVLAFKDFQEAKARAEELAKRENLEIIAFS